MDNLEHIDNYFRGILNDQDKKEFELKILNDAQFADDVAFYLKMIDSSNETLIEQQKKDFENLYKNQVGMSEMDTYGNSYGEFWVNGGDVHDELKDLFPSSNEELFLDDYYVISTDLRNLMNQVQILYNVSVTIHQSVNENTIITSGFFLKKDLTITELLEVLYHKTNEKFTFTFSSNNITVKKKDSTNVHQNLQ